MKRIITSAFVILLSIGAAQAQTASTEKNKVHKEHRKGGFDGLNLSADQQAKMTQIRTDFRSKAEVLRNNSALSQDQKRTQMKELMQQQQEQVKAVLTKEQREKMKSMKKDRSARNTK